ncbi:unnamed protein product [Brachionus calyciflorus]|uniref:Uncharacterized protein n=1 Tax=Brachionus calyciflorus TaxID=104777 RepID=A0A813V2V8_9BILA|nr:unnamed protein product [Brachionus calyciflorus]
MDWRGLYLLCIFIISVLFCFIFIEFVKQNNSINSKDIVNNGSILSTNAPNNPIQYQTNSTCFFTESFDLKDILGDLISTVNNSHTKVCTAVFLNSNFLISSNECLTNTTNFKSLYIKARTNKKLISNISKILSFNNGTYSLIELENSLYLKSFVCIGDAETSETFSKSYLLSSLNTSLSIELIKRNKTGNFNACLPYVNYIDISSKCLFYNKMKFDNFKKIYPNEKTFYGFTNIKYNGLETVYFDGFYQKDKYFLIKNHVKTVLYYFEERKNSCDQRNSEKCSLLKKLNNLDNFKKS